MKHAALAIIASISFHIAIATLVAVALAERDGLDVESARLDLSKMDFSLSYEETDAQPESADSLPPVSARETPPPPESAAVQPAEPPPPESAQAQPENPKLPEPEEVPCTVEMTSPPTPAPKQASIDAPPRRRGGQGCASCKICPGKIRRTRRSRSRPSCAGVQAQKPLAPHLISCASRAQRRQGQDRCR